MKTLFFCSTSEKDVIIYDKIEEDKKKQPDECIYAYERRFVRNLCVKLYELFKKEKK